MALVGFGRRLQFVMGAVGGWCREQRGVWGSAGAVPRSSMVELFGHAPALEFADTLQEAQSGSTSRCLQISKLGHVGTVLQ